MKNLPKGVYNEKKKRFDLPDKKSEFKTVEEELEFRQKNIEECTKVYRELLPVMLVRLSKIEDPRQQRKVKHKMTVLMVYGMLIFVLNFGSNRDVNEKMTMPIFCENLHSMFPELETMPHSKTLLRLLARIKVEEIQESLIDLFEELSRKKKFKKYLFEKRYLLSFDGTQKICRNHKWAEECSSKTFNKDTEEEYNKYSVYVLECVLTLDNGIVLPLYSEFIDNKQFKSEKNKQDTERTAFYRLAQKIKKRFPKLRIAVTLDGLSCCGPVIRMCRDFGWDFMITFKEGSMPDVWKEAMALIKITPEDSLDAYWGDRLQQFAWVNDIEYTFGDKNRNKEIINVAVCNEKWEEYSKTQDKFVAHSTRYVWISFKKLSRKNIFNRCTKFARSRWSIENNFLVLKHTDYSYEHCFSYTWKAMVGYHYLMNIGRFINQITSNCENIFNVVMVKGISGFIEFIRESIQGYPLNHDKIAMVISHRNYLKLRI